MNHDTNREDRVEPDRSATRIVWNCHRAYFRVCINCGDIENRQGDFRCPCAQPAEHS